MHFNGSLFDSRTKIFTTAPKAPDGLTGNLGPLDSVDVYQLASEGAQLYAIDRAGTAMTFNAPAGGACVVLGGPDDPLAQRVLELWTKAGLAPPRLVSSDIAELPGHVWEPLVEALEAELEQTAKDATALDRQLAVLREDLEEARAELWDLRLQLRNVGRFPVESFTRLPLAETLDLTPGEPVSQMLPFAGHMIRGIAICFDAATLGALDRAGTEVTLTAREDGALLGRWQVTSADLMPMTTIAEDGRSRRWRPGKSRPVNAKTWAMLALADPIPRKYRYIDLSISTARPTEPLPAVLLGDACGDDRAELKSRGEPRRDRMLAMRVWTGAPFDPDTSQRSVLFSEDRETLRDGYYLRRIPHDVVDRTAKLSDHATDQNWYRREGGDLFCHPAKSGRPNVLKLELDETLDMRGVSAMLELGHALAHPTAFGMVCSAFDLSEDEVVAALDQEGTADGATPDERILACQPWTVLPAGSSKPVQLRLARPVRRMNVYMATRPESPKVDRSWAWFRNLAILS